MMGDFTIDQLTIPATLNGPGGADFIRSVEVGNEVEAIGYGTADVTYEPDEELPIFSNPHEPKHVLVARVGGGIVARALCETTLGDDADTAWLTTEVLPEFRRRGIGTALADAVENMALADGKSKAIVYSPVAEGPGPRMDSPTGYGSIRADDPSVTFLTGRGYRLEQIERLSRLPLPIAGLDGLVVAAEERCGPEYRLHYWVGRTPERWREGIAHLGTRMSTDAPTAGLEEPEDIWTAERVKESDDRAERMSPRRRITAAVEHLPTGELAGFTILSVPQQQHRAVDQYATLVLKEHRGHALGMLLKVGNLAHLERVKPGHPSIMTFNAEENRHMLDVNEAVGFVPVASEGGWRKDLR
ncbi:MAG: GNAT family N-acetyltransferase [Salinibacterium sp.]|nr:GNAT family N-acetyltransferase [Salinibacterium sp.]